MHRSALLLSLFAFACTSSFGGNPTSDHNSDHQELLKLVASPLPSGAVAQDAATFYGPDNLYKYMDGAADIFVEYGVRTMLHLDATAKGVDIAVDVFDMGTPEIAFGMYAAERSPNYKFIAMGAEGYRNAGILNFLQDRYYVKLAAFGEGADSLLQSFARELSARIGAKPSLPLLLTRLPADNRKPRSEQYIPSNPLGHPFLSPAYVVAYSEGDQESKLYVTLARDEADARQRLTQLGEHFAKTGQSKAAPEIGEAAIRANNSFEGGVIALVRGRYLLLLMNPRASGEPLLKSAAERLQ